MPYYYDLRVLNSFCFFFLPHLSSVPSYYILWLFYRFLHPRVGQALKVLFSTSLAFS